MNIAITTQYLMTIQEILLPYGRQWILRSQDTGRVQIIASHKTFSMEHVHFNFFLQTTTLLPKHYNNNKKPRAESNHKNQSSVKCLPTITVKTTIHDTLKALQ